MQHKSPTLEQSRKREPGCEEDESGEEATTSVRPVWIIWVSGLFNDFFPLCSGV